jgi:flagellar hook-length control protein FliK
MEERRITMIAGQAIKSTIMDLAPSTRAVGTNGLKSSLVKGKDTLSFDSFLSNKAASETTAAQAPEKSISDTKKASASNNAKEIQSDNTSVNDSSASDNTGKDEVAKAKESSETKATETTKTDDSKLDAMAKTVEEVKEIVLKSLNISEEELTSMMEILGLTMVDLLNPDSLKQLTLQSAGTNDFMTLLTDEGLSQQLANLLDQVQGVLDKNGITQQDLRKHYLLTAQKMLLQSMKRQMQNLKIYRTTQLAILQMLPRSHRLNLL